MKVYLIVTVGPKKGMPIQIRGDLFLIGADPICNLRNRHLGPKHAAVVVREKKVFLRDMGSGRPTLVNQEMLDPDAEWPLHAGNRIVIGSLEFMVQFQEKPLSQKDLEEWAHRCLDQADSQFLFGHESDADDFLDPAIIGASNAAAAIIDRLSAQRGVMMGRLRIGTENGVTTVRFTDRYLVDLAEISMIKQELCAHLGHSNLRVLLDFKHVRRLSTKGIMMIFEFQRWLKPWGSSMALCRVRQEVREILPMLSEENIPYFHEKKTALEARW